jgi:Cd2+/Zn2+-exporting ATPase
MNESPKLRLDLPLILPDIHDAGDRCVGRLIETLSGRPGIDEAHVIDRDANAPKLCIHYDPSVISLTRMRDLVRSAGAELTSRYAHLMIPSAAPLGARTARRVASSLREVPGVLEAEIGASGALRIEYDRLVLSERELRGKALAFGVRSIASRASPSPAPAEARMVLPSEAPLKQNESTAGDHAGHDHGKGGDHAGHELAKSDDHVDGEDHAGHDHAHGGPFGEQSEVIFAVLAGVFLAAGWLSGRAQVGPAWLPLACYVVAYGFGGFFTVKEAFENLKARRFEIDTLMLVAAIGAAALGEWGEGALLLFLFSLGHSLEHYAMGRARRAIEALAKLAPETATVRREGRTEEVGVGKLQVGDVVVIKPNERVPADGVVTVGTSSVNQAPVTGESVPVDKRPVADAKAALAAFDSVGAENRVFAGTINGSGVLEVAVARRSDQSTMARVVKMVTEAEAQRSPTQQFTERFERIFVPAVLGLVGVMLFAWLIVDEPFSASFYRAMAVLVAASPCALAISVPSAVLSGVARAGRGGVLVKGGGPLENLGTLTSIAFDKTGTLTEGKPRLTDVVAAEGASEDELLTTALAVEEHSDHPLASAIVAGARERLGADT